MCHLGDLMTQQLRLWHSCLVERRLQRASSSFYGTIHSSGVTWSWVCPFLCRCLAAWPRQNPALPLPVRLDAGMTPPFWVRQEIGNGKPPGAWHRPLSGTVGSQLVSRHLWAIGKQGCAPRETGVGLNKGSPRLGIMGCSHRRSMLLGFTTKVGGEAPSLVHLREHKKGSSGTRAGAQLVGRWPSV